MNCPSLFIWLPMCTAENKGKLDFSLFFVCRRIALWVGALCFTCRSVLKHAGARTAHGSRCLSIVSSKLSVSFHLEGQTKEHLMEWVNAINYILSKVPCDCLFRFFCSFSGLGQIHLILLLHRLVKKLKRWTDLRTAEKQATSLPRLSSKQLVQASSLICSMLSGSRSLPRST